MEGLLVELERERLTAVRFYRRYLLLSALVVWAALAAAGALTLVVLKTSLVPTCIYLVMSAVFAGGILRSNARAPLRRYLARVRREVMPALVKALDPSLAYEPQQGIERDAFVAAKLFGYRTDRYATQDLVTGAVGGVPLRAARVTATEHRKDMDGDDVDDVFFSGLFVEIGLAKTLQGSTFVFPRAAKHGAPAGTERATLEDPELHRFFDVFGTDQIEVRYVLTPRLMETLASFARATDVQIRLRFTGRTLTVALPQVEVVLAFDPRRRGVTPEYLAAEAAHLQFLGNLVRALRDEPASVRRSAS